MMPLETKQYHKPAIRPKSSLGTPPHFSLAKLFNKPQKKKKLFSKSLHLLPPQPHYSKQGRIATSVYELSTWFPISSTILPRFSMSFNKYRTNEISIPALYCTAQAWQRLVWSTVKLKTVFIKNNLTEKFGRINTPCSAFPYYLVFKLFWNEVFIQQHPKTIPLIHLLSKGFPP